MKKLIDVLQKRYLYLAMLPMMFLLVGCGGLIGHRSPTGIDNSPQGRAKVVLKEAERYLGTPYKYGGTSRQGIDCSGLLWNSYKTVNIDLPRRSSEQARIGVSLRQREIKPGDAVFFNTSGSGISHAGIVQRVKSDEIFFIHSSTSRGVIVSSLNENYWNRRFVKAVRYLH